jgi:hypothetical protein
MGDVDASKRGFLTLSLAACVASCAQPFVTDKNLPDWAMVKRNYSVTFTGDGFERLARVGQKILPQVKSDRPWQYGLLEEDALIVTAVLGNGMLVSVKALQQCENDGQLAALMAWVVMFPLPSTRIAGQRNMTFAETNATVVVRADLAVIGALAKAGYDPRDALAIARRVPISDDVDTQLDAQRFSAMENGLRALGYQV